MWLPEGPSSAPTRRSGISMMRKHTEVSSRMPVGRKGGGWGVVCWWGVGRVWDFGDEEGHGRQLPDASVGEDASVREQGG